MPALMYLIDLIDLNLFEALLLLSSMQYAITVRVCLVLLTTHILMRCRPGIISHFGTCMPETLQSIQRHWLITYGSQLPDGVPYIVHIRHVDDYDAPTIPYPSCCVLMPGGLSYTPHKPGTQQQCLLLKQLAGEDA